MGPCQRGEEVSMNLAFRYTIEVICGTMPEKGGGFCEPGM